MNDKQFLKIYWSLKSVPGLSQMSKKNRKVVWRRCYLKSFRNWQTWVAVAACIACAGIGDVLGRMLGAETISTAIGGGFGGLIFGLVTAEMESRNIRKYLDSHPEAHHADDN